MVPTVASASKPSPHTYTSENKVPQPSTAISIDATHNDSIAFGYYGTDLRLPAFYDWSPARPTTRHQPSRYSEKRRIVRRGQVVVSIACKASRYRRRESSDTVPKSVTLSTPEYLTVLGSATADLTNLVAAVGSNRIHKKRVCIDRLKSCCRCLTILPPSTTNPICCHPTPLIAINTDFY